MKVLNFGFSMGVLDELGTATVAFQMEDGETVNLWVKNIPAAVSAPLLAYLEQEARRKFGLYQHDGLLEYQTFENEGDVPQ